MATKKDAETAIGAGTGGAAGGPETKGAGTSRSERERPRQVSREGTLEGVQPGESARAHPGGQWSAQQGGQQGMQRGGATGGRQAPSLLPAFMANPGLMASAFMTNPFEFAQLMSNEMDRIFETFGTSGGSFLSPGSFEGRQLGSSQRGSARSGSALTTGQTGQRGLAGFAGFGSFTPQIEVVQRGNELVVRADLPGLRPDDVNVEIEEGMLVISGERREEAEDRQEGFYHSERRYGSFYRAVPLPEGVSEDQINASFRDGVLEVTVPLPQVQQQRARRIPIRGTGEVSAPRSASAREGAGAGGAPGTSGGSPTIDDSGVRQG